MKNWHPARADHSIDRAAAVLSFVQPLDPDSFDDAIIKLRQVAKRHHMNNRVEALEPIDISAQIDIPLMFDPAAFAQSPPRRVVFRRLDTEGIPVEDLAIGSQRMIFSTLRYGRWTDFFRVITDAIDSVMDLTGFNTNTKSVQLEYVDRFKSTVSSSNHFEVIEAKSPYICSAISQNMNSVHSHSGWFDFDSDTVRRLTNVNVDVVHPNTAGDAQVSTITFLTMGRYEALENSLNDPREKINDLHVYLKNTFKSLITKKAQQRVALSD